MEKTRHVKISCKSRSHSLDRLAKKNQKATGLEKSNSPIPPGRIRPGVAVTAILQANFRLNRARKKRGRTKNQKPVGSLRSAAPPRGLLSIGPGKDEPRTDHQKGDTAQKSRHLLGREKTVGNGLPALGQSLGTGFS